MFSNLVPMDGAKSSFFGEHSSNAHHQLSGSEGWLSDRNCDLCNAMEFGDSTLMAKIGLLVGQRATQLCHLGQDVSMQDHSKCSMMSSLIDAADAKRRCVAASSACGPTQ